MESYGTVVAYGIPFDHGMERFLPFTGGRHGIIHVLGLRVRARADDLLRSGVHVVESRTAPARMGLNSTSSRVAARQVM